MVLQMLKKCPSGAVKSEDKQAVKCKKKKMVVAAQKGSKGQHPKAKKSNAMENNGLGPIKVRTKEQPLPERDCEGFLHFDDHPNFLPNLTPAEILQSGAFGGTYFRDLCCPLTGRQYTGQEVIRELPRTWFRGLDIETEVCSPHYNKRKNKFRVVCGNVPGEWESANCIVSLDPYGWFQWYCKFYLGRRTSDDRRQIKRWIAERGRRCDSVCASVVRAETTWDDQMIGRAARQAMHQWAYQLTEEDLERYTSSQQ